MIKAVILDLDDTLCLTEAICFEIENEALARLGRPPGLRSVHQATWGQMLNLAISQRSPGVDVDAFMQAFQPVNEAYVAAGKLDVVPPENYQALDELIAAGYHLMVLTSRTRAELAHLLEPDHLLASRVEAFYYRENLDYHKPDPRAFAGLLRDHALTPRECVYVGDSPGDAAGAQAAGLRFIASLESGLRSRADFSDHRVDSFIRAFPELVEAVSAL